MLKRMIKWAFRLFLITLSVLIVAGIFGGLWLQYRFQDPAWVTVSRVVRPELDWQSPRYPSLNWAFELAYKMLADDARLVFGHKMGAPQILDPQRLSFGIVGPRKNGASKPFYYDNEGRPVPLADVEAGVGFEHQIDPGVANKIINSLEQLEEALDGAQPGDHILILPGRYKIRGRALKLKAAGRVDAPIFLRGAAFGDVTLEFDMLEGFLVQGPYWAFENLVIRGSCQSDNNCEHGFHIVGAAENIVLRNIMAVNFNAAVKANRLGAGVPDNALIENSFFANEWPRMTTRPVTPIDVVAASGWRVTSTVIADFAKAKGNGISYGAFYKGGGEGGVFDRNLLMCEWHHYGGVRLGLSFGGGGTFSPQACRDGLCDKEHAEGIIRHNIIMNCPNDVGIYISRSPAADIHNNIVVGTAGVDIRFPQSSARISNNVLDGRIHARNGASYEESHNILSLWRAALLRDMVSHVYRAPERADFHIKAPGQLRRTGQPLTRFSLDFCGSIVNIEQPDIGAFNVETARLCNDLQNGGG